MVKYIYNSRPRNSNPRKLFQDMRRKEIQNWRGGLHGNNVMDNGLARNELIFRGTKMEKHTLFHIIKHRAFMWSVAGKLVPPDFHSLWVVEPQAAYHRRVKWELRNLIQHWFEFSLLIGCGWIVEKGQAR